MGHGEGGIRVGVKSVMKGWGRTSFSISIGCSLSDELVEDNAVKVSQDLVEELDDDSVLGMV